MSTHPTVLLVDDDPWLRSVLAEMFTDEGFAVLQAGNGFSAVTVAREQQPDAVVLDVDLPWRSGLHALADLQADARTARLPVLLMSGVADLAADARAHTATACFQKPLALGKVLACLRAAHLAGATRPN